MQHQHLVIPFSVTGSTYAQLYYGNKRRHSSMTGVALINERLLACTSYCMHKMWLVQFDMTLGNYQILDSIDTIGSNGHTGATDVLCYRNNDDDAKTGLLLASDFEHCSVSLYEVDLEALKLRYLRSIDNRACGHCHGVSFYPGDRDVIFFTTTGTKNPHCGVWGIRMSEKEPFFAFQEPGWLGKDVTFVHDTMMVAVFCNSAPHSSIERQYDAMIVVYQVDVHGNRSRRLTEYQLPRHHADSCIYKHGKLYVTVEGVDRPGRVVVFDVDHHTGMLTHTHDIEGYNFPHGVDVVDDTATTLIAVTEYGNSTVVLRSCGVCV